MFLLLNARSMRPLIVVFIFFILITRMRPLRGDMARGHGEGAWRARTTPQLMTELRSRIYATLVIHVISLSCLMMLSALHLGSDLYISYIRMGGRGGGVVGLQPDETCIVSCFGGLLDFLRKYFHHWRCFMYQHDRIGEGIDGLHLHLSFFEVSIYSTLLVTRIK